MHISALNTRIQNDTFRARKLRQRRTEKAEILDRTEPEPRNLKATDRTTPDQDHGILINADRIAPDQLILKISNRTTPDQKIFENLAPNRIKNIRKSRINSDRVAHGPSGALIPGF